MSARVATGDVSRKKTSFLFFWGSAVGVEEREVLVTAPAPLALPASSIPGYHRDCHCFGCFHGAFTGVCLSLAHDYVGSAPRLKRKSYIMRTMGYRVCWSYVLCVWSSVSAKDLSVCYLPKSSYYPRLCCDLSDLGRNYLRLVKSLAQDQYLNLSHLMVEPGL